MKIVLSYVFGLAKTIFGLFFLQLTIFHNFRERANIRQSDIPIDNYYCEQV